MLDAPLVVVLGHDCCRAIAAARAAADGGALPGGFVRDVVERVPPSVLTARAAGRNQAEEILAARVEHTVHLLLERSRVLAERVASGRLGVVGLSYRLADGSAQLVASRGLEAETCAAPRRPRRDVLGPETSPSRRASASGSSKGTVSVLVIGWAGALRRGGAGSRSPVPARLPPAVTR